jgi:hypothetical protein
LAAPFAPRGNGSSFDTVAWRARFSVALHWAHSFTPGNGSSCDTVTWRARFSAALHWAHSLPPGSLGRPQIVQLIDGSSTARPGANSTGTPRKPAAAFAPVL